jgi:murein L,D-transpeptidase YafK
MKLFPLIFLVIFACCTNFTPVKPSESEHRKPIKEIVDSLQIPAVDIQVKVFKSDYKLEVWDSEKALRSYKIVLGGNPTGQKLMEGDRKTPEGTFKVRNLYPHAKWSKFIWFDYPNEQSELNHAQAKADGTLPAKASIGGEVGIHGVPEGMDYWVEEGANWTLGCVSLTNTDVNDLYSVIQKGTNITIFP